MREISHRSRNRARLAPAVDVAALPDLQPMLLRLGLAVGDINASYINRVAYVKQVASAIVAARLRK